MKPLLSHRCLFAAVLFISLRLYKSDGCPTGATTSAILNIVEDMGEESGTTTRELVVDFNEQYNGGVDTTVIDHVFRDNELVFNQFFEWGGVGERGKLYKEWIDREAIAMQLFNTYSPVRFVFDILFYNRDLALTRCLNVTINVKDLDDNTPMFNQDTVQVTFEDDNTETGKERVLPHPGDHDEGNNGTTVYELVDSSGKFGLEFRNYTGTTRVLALSLRNDLPLDHEERASYQLELRVREYNENPDHAVLTINVEVADVCDEPSTFSTSRYTPTISEDASINTVVATVEAADDDDSEVCPLEYSITRVCGRNTPADPCYSISTPDQPFVLDSESGLLTLTAELDRERIVEYEVTVQATDRQSSATALIVITVDDINDNCPEIIDNILNRIPEHQRVDPTISIGTFTILDADAGQNGQVSVSLLDNSTGVPLDSQTFRLTTQSHIDYQIILNRSLDYETQSEFNLIIHVRDNGTQPCFTDEAVTITITDHNDHSPVFGSIPEATIEENSVLNTFVVAVTATDEDSGANAVVTFDLAESSEDYPHQHLFKIDTSGNILVRDGGPLDYETNTNYTVQVVASNSESIHYLETRKDVVIFLENVNDNPPQISVPHIEVNETLQVGRPIGQIVGTDADNLTPLTYSLGSGSSSLFSIVPSEGVLVLEGRLDYEVTDSHSVTVEVWDGDHMASAEVTINVLPVNDETPIFNNEPYIARVREEQGNVLVTTVTATDRDNPPDTINYVIRQGAHLDRFRINSDGEIHTTQPLDREQTPNYTLWVQANDGVLNSTLKQLFIQVIDINDHVPYFVNLPYNFAVMENSQNPAVGTVAVISLDEGPNHVVKFDISSGNSNGWFSIDEDSGEITAMHAFDHEVDQSPIVLMVRARDQGEPSPHSNVTTVTVTITDVNDNEPVFPHTLYSFTVGEDYPIGQVFGKVVATDTDGIGNNVTRYSFSQETDASAFHIKEFTGELSLVTSLDFETSNRTTFDVIATDDTRRDYQTSTTVVITVTNARDLNLTFPEDFSPHFSVVENTEENHTITTLEVTDTMLNSVNRLIYNLTTDTHEPSPHFGIRKQGYTAYIYTSTHTINREADDLDDDKVYRLILNVSDPDTTPDSYGYIVSYITIEVLDENDNSPMFLNPIAKYSIWENGNAGELVGSFEVVDPDAGSNGTIHLSINSIVPFNVTHVEQNNGQELAVIRVVSPLDRETQSIYEFLLQALDQGNPSRQTTMEIIVHVLDINDNAPVFCSDPPASGVCEFTFSVREDHETQEVIATVEATDADEGSNADIRYEFVPGVLVGSRFTIESNTGKIILGESLDRESISGYSFQVRAVDGGDKASTAKVIIEVEDVNEYPPVFTNSSFSTLIAENFASGVPFTSLLATDQDIAPNSIVRYALADYSLSRIFEVDKDTGEISIRNKINDCETIDHERKNEYKVNIIAYDNGSPPKYSNETLTVRVQDVNEHTPLFDVSEVHILMSETAQVGSRVLEIEAYDRDYDNSLVYTLSPDDSPFNWDNTNRALVLKSGVSSVTSGSLISVQLTASDGERHSSIFITVLVLNENDNEPVFSTQDDTITISENAELSSSVFTVHASDADNATNDAVVYSISDGNADGTFFINPQSGVIYVAQDLDYETESRYMLTILATDTGEPAKTSTPLHITIEVTNENDEVPVFQREEYTFRLVENSAEAASIGCVRADDVDNGDFGVTLYSIVDEGERPGFFVINRDTGCISAIQTVDRETDSEFHLTVQAQDKANPSVTDTVEVTVEIDDLNDNGPSFPQPTFLFYISPDHDINKPLGLLRASDPDNGNNASFTYTVVSQNPNLISLSQDGEVSLVTEIPTEYESSYSIVVNATSAVEGDDRSSEATVMVIVESTSEHHPRFTQQTYEEHVTESASEGHGIFDASEVVSDQDGISGLTYSFANDYEQFALDSETGLLTLQTQLNYEDVRRYEVRIKATDSTARVATATLIINVEDGNDHAPIFISPPTDLVLSPIPYTNIQLFSVRADDADVGPQGTVGYSIVEESSGTFEIDSQTGVVTNKVNLITNDTYMFVIRAFDHGSPLMSSNITVRIRIDDTSNRPQFTNGESTIDIMVPENKNSKTDPVIRGFSTQPVAESYHLVYSNASKEMFSIDMGNKLVLNSQLDYETASQYLLIIEARSISNGMRLSSFLLVNIMVTDVNDNEPHFRDLPKQEISELESAGTEVFTVTATDDDSGRNAEITYAITGGNSENAFEIDQSTGSVSLIKSLDRETTPTYSLIIRATDDGEEPKQNQTTVSIEVVDVNDNPPVFGQANYSISVYEYPHSHVGDSVIQIVAKDADTGSLSYYIQLLEGSHGGRTRTVSSDTFRIDFDTGNITLHRDLNREEVDSYFIRVEARDMDATHTAVAYLTVKVLDVNDNAPVFLTGHIDYVPVDELSPINTQILLRQEVTDRDIGQNSLVKYSLGSGWPEGLFKIDQWTGVLRTARSFQYDRNLDGFVGRVRAVDQGIPPREAEMTVRVYIRDVNNHPPVLDNTNFHFEISVDHPMDEPITEFNYSDESDSSYNTITLLRIPDYYSVANSLFQMALIDMENKPVLLKLHRSPLETRDIGEHQFRIEAIQQASIPLCPQYIQTSYAHVTVVIHPTNAHAPVFSHPQIVCEIPENSAVGTDVVVDNLFATDADGNGVTYKILTSNVPFEISDPSSPTITVTGPLDADSVATASYTLTVQASDDGFPVRSSNATLTINTLDINDIPPTFEMESYSGTVLENSEQGTSVLSVSAVDPDSTILSYSIEYPTDCDANCFPFQIEPSGEMNTISDIDYEQRERYSFRVMVSDTLHTAYVPATIDVIGENEYKPTFKDKRFEFTVSAGQSLVGKIEATDQDGGNEGRLLFSFSDDIESKYDVLTLNSTTGEIFLVETSPSSARRKRAIETFDNTVILTRAVMVRDMGEVPQSDVAQIAVSFDKSFFEKLVGGTSPATPTTTDPPFEIIIIVVLAVVVAIVVFLGIIVVACLCRRHSKNSKFKVEDAHLNESSRGGSEMTERYRHNGTSLDSKKVETSKLQTGNSASGSERSYTGTADDEMDSGNERYTGHSPNLPNKPLQNGSPRMRSTSDLASSVGTDALHSQVEHPYTKAQLMRIYANNEGLLDDNVSHDSVHLFGSEGGREVDGELDITNLIFQKINDLEDDEESTTIMDDDASTTYSKDRGAVLTGSVGNIMPPEDREDPLNYPNTTKGWIPPTGRPIDETIDEITATSSFASQEEPLPRRHGYDLGPYSHSQGASLYNPSATQESFIGIQQPPKFYKDPKIPDYPRRYYPEEHHDRVPRERERERPRYPASSHRYGSASVLPDYHHHHHHNHHHHNHHQVPGHRQHYRSQDLALPYPKYSPYTRGARRPHPNTYMTPTEGTDGTVTPQTALTGDYHYLSSSSTSLTSTNVSGNLSQPSRPPQMYH